MTDRCDVVVVGGGVMGCSLALHLVEAGAGSVRLLERDGLFEATSGAGAGFLGMWAVASPTYGPEEIAVERYGLDFYADLARSNDIEFRQNGVLFVAANEAAWESLRSSVDHDAEPHSSALDPPAVEAATSGAVRAEGVVGAVLRPSGAQIYAPKVGAALIDRFVELGGIVETRRPVTGLSVHGGRANGVETQTGPIACDTVVLAAGAWTNDLLRPHGVYLPAVPQVTSRLITEPLGIPATMPTLFLAGLVSEPGGGTVLWVREHRGGLLWGGAYESHPRDLLVDAPVPARFDELPIDGVLECQRIAKHAARCMPALSQATSVRLKHGAPCYTPDMRALVGPVPGIEGLHALAGDNEAGITHGPGFGKALADRITSGRSDLTSLDAWRLDRFEDRFTGDLEVAAAVKQTAPA